MFRRVFFFAVSRNPAAVVAGNEKSILKTFPWEEERGDGKRETREQQAKVAEKENFPNQDSQKSLQQMQNVAREFRITNDIEQKLM